jgi:hypothetical protein
MQVDNDGGEPTSPKSTGRKSMKGRRVSELSDILSKRMSQSPPTTSFSLRPSRPTIGTP